MGGESGKEGGGSRTGKLLLTFNLLANGKKGRELCTESTGRAL